MVEKTAPAGKEVVQRHKDGQTPHRSSSHNEFVISLRLAEGVLYVSQRACQEIQRQAVEAAFERIRSPLGTTQSDRVEFNLLLAKGLDCNSKDDKGQTLLMAACYVGDTETVLQLKGRGANKDLLDNEGRNAVVWTEMSGREEKAEILDILNKWNSIEGQDQKPKEPGTV
jgi:hypothetical protein